MVGQECFEEALLEGTREVFETMMFMAVEECNELYEGIEGQALLGTITFRGDIEGCLGVCCGLGTAQMIAANMLGLDPGEEAPADEVPDAIGEVANMVMGAIKSRIAEAVGDVQVSIPTVVSGTELENSLGDDARRICRLVSIDDMPTLLTFLYRDRKSQ